MKKLLWALLIAAAALSLLSCAALAAPTFTEQEINDYRDGAHVLCLNAEMEGALSYGDAYDVDAFRLIVPASGRINLQLRHDYVDTSSTVVNVSVYWPGRDDQLWWADVPGNQAEISYFGFYLDAGEYDLVLTAKSRNELNYALLASYAEEPNAELEYNDTPDAATPIRPNEDWYGATGVRGDVDCFTLALDEPGAVALGFNHEYFDKGDTFWKVELTQGIAAEVIRSFEVDGRTNEWTTNEFYLDAGTYTVRVEGKSFTSRPYVLRADYRPDANAEREGNETFETATPVGVNAEIHGALTRREDVDFYRFELDAPGEVVFTHAHEFFEKGDTYYEVSLYNDTRSDARMLSFGITGRQSEFTKNAVYLPAGVYYLQYKTNYFTTRPYAYTLAYTPAEDIELEWNNDYVSATPIETGVTYAGSLMTRDDRDYYTFSLDEACEVQLAFSFEFFDKGDCYFALSLDTDPRDDTTYLSHRLSGRDNDLLTNPFYLAAGTYYVRVQPDYHTSIPYALSLQATPRDDVELEWNDSYATATPLALGQSITGTLGSRSDQDYYVLNVDSPCAVSLRLAHEWFDRGDTYYVVAIDPEPSKVNRIASMRLSGRDAEKRSDPIQLQPGTYYVSVSADHYSSLPYVLSVG